MDVLTHCKRAGSKTTGHRLTARPAVYAHPVKRSVEISLKGRAQLAIERHAPSATELRLRGFASRRIVHRYSTEIETLPQVRNWKHLADRHVRILRRDMVGAW